MLRYNKKKPGNLRTYLSLQLMKIDFELTQQPKKKSIYAVEGLVFFQVLILSKMSNIFKAITN